MKIRSILAFCFMLVLATAVVAGSAIAQGGADVPTPAPFTQSDSAIYTIEGMTGNGILLQIWGHETKAAGAMTWMSYGTEDQLWFVGLLDEDASAPGIYQFDLYRPTADNLAGANHRVGPPLGIVTVIKSDTDGEMLMNYRFTGGFAECTNFSPASESCAGTVFLRRLTPKELPRDGS